ncbi:MAG: hypothetical protein AB7K24_01295 [Gemmataceae bacterium]
MILFYSLLIVCLSVMAWALNRRVAALENKFGQAAVVVDKLAEEMDVKPGNRSRDPCVQARQQFRLGQLVEKRDRIEEKYTAWSERAERFAGWLARVKEWKGRKLPYTFGALDMSALFYLIDRLGPHQPVLASLFESVRQYLGV